MKNKNIYYVIAALIAGFVLGFLFRSYIRLPEANLMSLICNYNGVVYKNGDGFKSTDGCNSCSCMNGEVACTLMACNP